ncbi:TnsA endonuclease N-terminal domain-containing protein [Pseudomonas mohnii]
MKADSLSHGFSRDVAKRVRRAGRAYVMCSAKNGNLEIRLESRLEQSVAQALELDPRVRAYRAQPFTLDLATGDLLPEKHLIKPQGTLYYTPDFSVELADLQIVLEVKPRAFLEEHKELLGKVRSMLISKGMRFIVISEDHFTGHYLRNIQLFMPFLTQAAHSLSAWAAPLQRCTPEQLKGPVRQALDTGTPANYQVGAGVLLGIIKFDMALYLFERMDFEIAPAFGSLSAFEVIRYEP